MMVSIAGYMVSEYLMYVIFSYIAVFAAGIAWVGVEYTVRGRFRLSSIVGVSTMVMVVALYWGNVRIGFVHAVLGFALAALIVAIVWLVVKLKKGEV